MQTKSDTETRRNSKETVQRTDENCLEINEYYHRAWRKYHRYEKKTKMLIKAHSEN